MTFALPGVARAPIFPRRVDEAVEGRVEASRREGEPAYWDVSDSLWLRPRVGANGGISAGCRRE
jgi:hypothetical protein